MKTRTYAMLAVAASTLCGGAFFAGKAIAQPAPPPFVAPEAHPEIHRAMRQLNNAYTTMTNAADDFGGHKSKAMGDTKAAINELRAALRYDKH